MKRKEDIVGAMMVALLVGLVTIVVCSTPEEQLANAQQVHGEFALVYNSALALIDAADPPLRDDDEAVIITNMLRAVFESTRQPGSLWNNLGEPERDAILQGMRRTALAEEEATSNTLSMAKVRRRTIEEQIASRQSARR